MATLSNIQHLSSHSVQGGQQIRQNQSINVWGWKGHRGSLKMCRNNFSLRVLMCVCLCFLMRSPVILRWAVVAIRHTVRGERPFHSHQLAGMCSCRLCVSACGGPCVHNPPWRYAAATWAWARMLIRITSVDVDFCNAASCWVNLRVAFSFCIAAVFVSLLLSSSYQAQRLVVYSYQTSGASFLPRCLAGCRKWGSMRRNSSSQARHTVIVGQSNRRWGEDSAV